MSGVLQGDVTLDRDVVGVVMVLSPASDASEQYGTALSHSTFTASNGTSLDAYTPEIGPDWVEANGAWEIQSNEATTSGVLPGEPKFVATVDLGTPDVTLDAICRLTADGSMMLVLRYQDGNNFTVAQFYSWAGGGVEIWECSGGAFTQRANAAVTINTLTDYRITASIIGATIRCAVNGVFVVGYTSASVAPTATKHGMRMENTALSPYKSLVIWPREYEV
jgi:hypothetical protein